MYNPFSIKINSNNNKHNNSNNKINKIINKSNINRNFCHKKYHIRVKKIDILMIYRMKF
jgi:hypothetical protein